MNEVKEIIGILSTMNQSQLWQDVIKRPAFMCEVVAQLPESLDEALSRLTSSHLHLR